MTAEWDVCGIGNALVDIVASIDDALLARLGLVKGAMELVDLERSEQLSRSCRPESSCSGGSAANTMAVLAALGGRAAYLGKVHDDELGRLFVEDMRRSGVEVLLEPAGACPATGRCLVLISADAERTMQTYLGASTTLEPGDIPAERLGRCRILYLEGYLYDPEPARRAMLRAARLVRSAGRRVSLSLSDSFCVERHLEEFRRLVNDEMDVVFGNEHEVRALAGSADLDRALEAAGAMCPLVVATLGAEGTALVIDGRVERVPAHPVERVVDTTGAGDSFAAGFLYGLSRGWPPRRCAELGGVVAAEIISQVGARPSSSLASLPLGMSA